MTSAYLERPLRSFAQASADLAHRRETLTSSNLPLEQQRTARENDDGVATANAADLSRHLADSRRGARWRDRRLGAGFCSQFVP